MKHRSYLDLRIFERSVDLGPQIGEAAGAGRLVEPVSEQAETANVLDVGATPRAVPARYAHRIYPSVADASELRVSPEKYAPATSRVGSVAAGGLEPPTQRL